MISVHLHLRAAEERVEPHTVRPADALLEGRDERSSREASS
jgi:hypothetical protein